MSVAHPSRSLLNHSGKMIIEARKYPAGVTAFCTAYGISKNNYYSWFKKLRHLHPEWTDLANVPAEPRRQTKRKKKNRPETEVTERPRRRKFTAKDKAK